MAKGLWVLLNVESIEKSVEFYKGLGLKAGVDAAPGMRWGFVNATADAGVVLWDKNVLGPDQPEDTRAWLTGEMGKGVMIAFGVPNAEKAWAKAQAMRLNVETPLRDQPWGGREFTVVDPDGFVVNITDRFPDEKPVRRKEKKAVKRVAAKAKRVAGKRTTPKRKAAKATRRR